MVIEEKRILETIYIKNHDLYESICEYHPSSGMNRQILRTEINSSKLARGFYVNINGVNVGLYASSKGPVVFNNSDQFLLEEGKYYMKLEEKLDSRIFTLIIDSKEKFIIFYGKSKYVNYDVWSDEEAIDFFYWLFQNQNKEEFHKYYNLS